MHGSHMVYQRKSRGAGSVSHSHRPAVECTGCPMQMVVGATGLPWFTAYVSEDVGVAEAMSALSSQSLGVDLGWSHGYLI